MSQYSLAKNLGSLYDTDVIYSAELFDEETVIYTRSSHMGSLTRRFFSSIISAVPMFLIGWIMIGWEEIISFLKILVDITLILKLGGSVFLVFAFYISKVPEGKEKLVNALHRDVMNSTIAVMTGVLTLKMFLMLLVP